jgi:hypothetical protein
MTTHTPYNINGLRVNTWILKLHRMKPFKTSYSCESTYRTKVLVITRFNATFNNISVISCRSVLLVEETGIPGKNHRHMLNNYILVITKTFVLYVDNRNREAVVIVW